MKHLLVLVLIVTSAFAGVLPGTLHRSDCETFQAYLDEAGVYGADTKIEYKNSGTHYVAYFNRPYNLEDDWTEAFSVAVCAGLVSNSTSWRSGACISVYTNKVVIILTEDCRILVRAWEQQYSLDQLLEYYLMYSFAYPRGETNW